MNTEMDVLVIENFFTPKKNRIKKFVQIIASEAEKNIIINNVIRTP